MVTTTDVLLRILRNALWQEPIPAVLIPSRNLKQLLALAKEQTVTGLVCSTLMDSRNAITLDRRDAAELYATYQDLQNRNKLVNDELLSLSHLLNRHSIRYAVIKGQTIAAHYPEPLARTSGDIDFYVHPEDFDQACAVIEKEYLLAPLPTITSTEEDQHIPFSHNDVHYEMHFCLLKFASRKSQHYFDSLVNQYLANADIHPSTVFPSPHPFSNVKVLPPTLNLLYTFLHLYHHLLELGCGLRQFIDLAVLLHTQPIDHAELRTYLKALDMERAFDAILQILHTILGLPRDTMPTAHHIKAKTQKSITKIIFLHGNFGFYRQKYATRSGWRYNLDATKRKLRHYRLFYSLSPREIRCSLIYSIPQKVLAALKRQN